MSNLQKIDWRSMFKGVVQRMREAGESQEMGARWMATEANKAVAAARDANDAEIVRLREIVERAQAIISTATYPNWHETARAALNHGDSDA